MRDFRDAKAMAQSLRGAMAARNLALGHSECLELVSTMLGFADWNTLSAYIGARGDTPPPGKAAQIWPVFPVKDTVPFPGMQLPIWIKRPKTVEALRQAFSRRRELVLVAQKTPEMETPGPDDIYDMGVMARVLDVGPPAAEAVAVSALLEGSTQILLQTEGRVAIRHFSGQAGAYEAEVEPIGEGDIPAAPDLIAAAASRFETFAAARGIGLSGIWPPVGKLNDPGRVADVIAHRLPLATAQKQAVLATLDPIARLERVIAHMDA